MAPPTPPGARRSAQVSLCMIVRDEARFLAACLESARPWVDEICVVDTGSTDATVGIARAHGARLSRIVWPDSFAEARNVSLEMATGDWILVLDADETLRTESGRVLRAAVLDETLAGALVEVRGETHAGPESLQLLRLFRSAPEHRYVGIIHEQVSPAVKRTALERGQRIVHADIVVDHYGYTSEVRTARDKEARNRRLFELACAQTPDDAHLWFKYADFLRGTDPAAAPAAFERTLALLEGLEPAELRELSFGGEAYALHALGFLQAGDLQRAGALLERAGAHCEPSAHLDYVTGAWALQAGRPSLARAAFGRCRARHGRPQVQSAAATITGERSALGIAQALLRENRAAEALRHLAAERLVLADSSLLAHWHARLAGELALEAGRDERGAHVGVDLDRVSPSR